MRVSIYFLLLCTAVFTSAVRIKFMRVGTRRFKNKFKVGFSKVGRGFKSVICRIKHRKVVLDTSRRFDRCEKTCPYLYKEKYSLHWGHHCVPIVIPYGCVDENCVRCKEGFYWLAKKYQRSSCVKTCPSGYFHNVMDVCQRCGVKDCLKCNNKWQCVQCKRGKNLYKTLMRSTVCINKCPQTHTVKTLNGENNCVKIPTKKPTTVKTTTTSTTTVLSSVDTAGSPANLLSGCLDVSCTKCKSGFSNYIFATGGRACVRKCPKGQASVRGLCVSCYDRRCSQCDTSLSECNDCFPGYAKITGTHGTATECVIECPPKFKEEISAHGNRTCTKDSSSDCDVLNCEQCYQNVTEKSKNKCSRCLSGFVLFEGSMADHCYRTCPPGYTVNPENQVSKCIEILPTGCKDKLCTECKEEYFGYLLATGARACVKKCPQGTTNMQGLCVSCYDHRCSRCDTTLSDCKQCFPGYAKVIGAHNMTTECAIECPAFFLEKNINGTRICERIDDTVCPILNCKQCISGTLELRIGCLECRQGFVLFRDSVADHCYRNCPPGFDDAIHAETGAAICSPILPPGCLDKECLKCEEGYNNYFLLTGGRVCVEKCPDGYASVSGLCVACSDRRCRKCSNDLSECEQCFPGYARVLGAFNSSSECVIDCPSYYKESVEENRRVCVEKQASDCAVSNCKKCIDGRLDKIHQGCFECEKDFVLYRGALADRCYKTCPPGYYSDVNPQSGVKICLECKSPFCSKCSNATVCEECHEPLLLDEYRNMCRTCPALTNYNFKLKRCVNLGSQFYGGNVIV